MKIFLKTKNNPFKYSRYGLIRLLKQDNFAPNFISISNGNLMLIIFKRICINVSFGFILNHTFQACCFTRITI
jgi:hypothetical protein